MKDYSKLENAEPIPELKYKSPIEVIRGNIKTEVEGEIMRAVQQVGVVIDTKELIKALNYDRQQYEKGARDTIEKAKAEIVRLITMREDAIASAPVCHSAEYLGHEIDGLMFALDALEEAQP